MATIHFAARLRHVAPAGEVASHARTLLDALGDVFATHPMLRAYVLDEQDDLRKHVTIFVDGRRINSGELGMTLSASAQIYVLQALSGG